MNRAYPEAFLRACERVFGAEYPEFARALDGEPARALRLNPLRAGAEAAAREYLTGECVPWEPLGRYIAPEKRPGGAISHAAGAYYLQDASAMAAVAALNPLPGERVMDLCAAPGGKSGQIAARMRGEGFLMANETVFARAKALSGNLERLGVSNAYVSCARPDALARLLPEYFDALIVDAPCSGEGMFRREARALSEWTPESPIGCAARQREILESAAKLVRPGGRLAYSTCTFNDIENEGVIRAFLSAHAEFAPESFALNGAGEAIGGMLRLSPHKIKGEGHFIARLRKSETAPRVSKLAPRAQDARKTDSSAAEAAQTLLKYVVRALPDGELYTRESEVWLLPADAPHPDEALKQISLLRAGLKLARAEAGYIKPDHALAMALDPINARRAVELSAADARAYLAGEALNSAGEDGWTLVCFLGMPLGWAKRADGALKNHLPKGLRRRGTHDFETEA